MAKLTPADTRAFRRNLNYGHLAGSATVFIIIGGVFYHFVEKFSWLDSFYFTFITLATVGYGDLAPRTNAGKFSPCSMCYLVWLSSSCLPGWCWQVRHLVLSAA